MADVIFVAVIVAFFALAVAYVRACERIVGRDVATEAALGSDSDRGDDRPARRFDPTSTPLGRR